MFFYYLVRPSDTSCDSESCVEFYRSSPEYFYYLAGVGGLKYTDIRSVVAGLMEQEDFSRVFLLPSPVKFQKDKQIFGLRVFFALFGEDDYA